MPPASTSSVTSFLRNRARPAAAAPSRHQACGTPSTVAGSAAPSRARTKTSRPAARQDSTRRRGSSPHPATIPSLSAIRPLRLTDGPARIGADEFDDVVDRPNSAEALRGLGHPVAERPVCGEQELVRVAQRLDILATDAAALHPDDIEPAQTSPVSHYLAVGDDIALDAGHPADHRVHTDPSVLVYRAESPKNGVILDNDVAPKRRVVGHDDMVADLAIVGDMCANHKKAAVTNPGDHAAACGSGVYCHIFPDRVVAPDDKLRLFTAILEILRLEPNRGERKQARTLADRRPAIDHDV